MAEPTDYTQAGEIFRKSMKEAIAHLDQVKEDLLKEQAKAIEDQIAAKEELHRIKREAHTISEAYMDHHRKEIEQRIRDEVLRNVTQKLILAEIPSNKIKQHLELPAQLLADAWMYLGFERLDDQHVAHIAYETSGRTGTVIFYRDDMTLRLPFEFGGGSTLAFIQVPTVENWEKETHLTTAERMPILEFIAKRVIRDQAQNCHFEIQSDSIVIQY